MSDVPNPKNLFACTFLLIREALNLARPLPIDNIVLSVACGVIFYNRWSAAALSVARLRQAGSVCKGGDKTGI